MINEEAHPEEARCGGIGSVQALGVSAKGVPCVCPSYKCQLPVVTINSLGPSHGLLSCRSSPG